MIRAVIDTNVLVSAFLSPGGSAALILQAIIEGLIPIFLTDDIAQEYADVLNRPRFAFDPDTVRVTLDHIHRHAEFVEPNLSAPVSPDPDDTMFLQCAVAAQADVIVTGNLRDFPNSPYGQVHVVTINEFLQRLASEMRT